MSETLNPEFIPYFWYILGIILLSIEFAMLPGVGLFFTGLGAITAGIANQVGWADDTLTQLVIFFGSTIVYGILLWKPMKAINKNKKGYQNIVGEQAEVIKDITKTKAGLVRWSGTNMKAQASEISQKHSFKTGDSVEIVEIKGNTLYIK